MIPTAADRWFHFTRDEVALAVGYLRKPPLIRLPACRIDSRRHEAIEHRRPPLAHTVYVERSQYGLFGVVCFFGVIHVYCGLSRTGRSNGNCTNCSAVFTWPVITA